jgi:hypothetical protein
MAGVVEPYPPSSSVGTAPAGGVYGMDTASSATWPQASSHHLHARPSLPTLHTRSSWMDNSYDTYENSPVDGYTYGTSFLPRQDSFASSFGGIENYRSWSTTAPMSAPVTASYNYDQQPTYSFGSLSAPFTAGPSTRLPSVSAEAFSPLNMASLQTSLPIQTAQERRLPVPYTIQYPTPHSASQIPQVRPLGSYSEPRLPTHGIHSRTAMPWSQDSVAGSTRTSSASNYLPMGGLPAVQQMQPIQQPNVAPITEPAFGYQFGHTNGPQTTSASPDVSPTTISAPAEDYTSSVLDNSGMPPPPSSSTGRFRYASASHQPLPAISTDLYASSPSSTRDMHNDAQSLFSFSTDTGERNTINTDDSEQSVSNIANSNTTIGGLPSISHSAYLPLRQPQPQSSGSSNSIEALCRHASYEHLPQLPQLSQPPAPTPLMMPTSAEPRPGHSVRASTASQRMSGGSSGGGR